MEPAREKLAKAIAETVFHDPICPIYQNVSTTGMTDVEMIKENLIAQLTAPVKWTQSVENMVKDGASQFLECGPGKVLQGLVKKIQIGRASCRERVEVGTVAASLSDRDR